MFCDLLKFTNNSLLYGAPGVLLCCPVWVITSIWHSERIKQPKTARKFYGVFWFIWLFKCLWSDVVRLHMQGFWWKWAELTLAVLSWYPFHRKLFCPEQIYSWAVFVTGRLSSIIWYHESILRRPLQIEITRSPLMAPLQSAIFFLITSADELACTWFCLCFFRKEFSSISYQIYFFTAENK